ncbi:hypothetical protein ACOMHN_036477 [Nucella lapillus]
MEGFRYKTEILPVITYATTKTIPSTTISEKVVFITGTCPHSGKTGAFPLTQEGILPSAGTDSQPQPTSLSQEDGRVPHSQPAEFLPSPAVNSATCKQVLPMLTSDNPVSDVDNLHGRNIASGSPDDDTGCGRDSNTQPPVKGDTVGLGQNNPAKQGYEGFKLKLSMDEGQALSSCKSEEGDGNAIGETDNCQAAVDDVDGVDDTDDTASNQGHAWVNATDIEGGTSPCKHFRTGKKSKKKNPHDCLASFNAKQ